MKFLLTTGGKYEEGFKVSFTADTEEEIEVVDKVELKEKLKATTEQIKKNTEEDEEIDVNKIPF